MLYSASELPEFLAAISASAESGRGLTNGIGRIAETFDAEVVAVVREGEVIASVGFPREDAARPDVIEAAANRASGIDIAGVGWTPASTVYLDEPDSVLVIARVSEPLTSIELAHAQSMARILALAMNLVDQLDENKRLVAEQQRLLEEHQVHHAVQDAILRVQRLISQRRPIQSILEAITAEAALLFGSDLAGICLYAPQGRAQRCLAGNTDVGRRLMSALSEQQIVAIGEQATSSRIGGPTPFTVPGVDGQSVDATVIGSQVYDDGALIGGLFVLSATTPSVQWEVDTALLETFASQASIALADASTIDELEHAFHDHLTGLPNRALFHDRFDHALELGARLGTTTGLLFLDLDRFKLVNDTLGHAAGDALLRGVGEALQSGGRACDSVARIGGDEFAIVLEGTGPEAAMAVAKRLLAEVGSVINPSGGRDQPGVSIGIALSGPDCHTTDELLRRADIAMYSVKKSGRAGIALYDSKMGQSRLDENGLTDAFQAALARDEFVVHYQPIVNLRNRRISGVEALVRWQDPQRGLVPPAAFINAAERTGMIMPIGRRVLQLACMQAAEWRRTIPNAADLTVSVNLSACQLEDDSIGVDVTDALGAAELDPAALTLEVTESVFVNSAGNASNRLHALKDLGISLAIDDFGTGFSSLSYIHNYPFDILKIDRSFIKGIGSSTNKGAVARTMLTLAQQLSMSTVAEGIESRGELAQLRALRCTHGQGFLFARPTDAESLRSVLAAENCSVTS